MPVKALPVCPEYHSADTLCLGILQTPSVILAQIGDPDSHSEVLPHCVELDPLPVVPHIADAAVDRECGIVVMWGVLQRDDHIGRHLLHDRGNLLLGFGVEDEVPDDQSLAQ